MSPSVSPALCCLLMCLCYSFIFVLGNMIKFPSTLFLHLMSDISEQLMIYLNWSIMHSSKMKDKQLQLLIILQKLLPCKKCQFLRTFSIHYFGKFDKVNVKDLLFSPHFSSHSRTIANAFEKVL